MQFSVDDMTCGRCARAITEAVREADPVASVTVDVGAKCVTVVSDVPSGEIVRAISVAGYTAVIRTGR
ncbi:heavy-metal-associated domain-containing protein [Paraburkholderia fungorum]|nr:heavy-metal-associated domain-containing protein [Paraburkholderia fungorum]AJZ56378.1 heavy-metal-associated domain protein [Paraburkholderia fungorum]MBU7440595.1 heavy-metal-associated domain-containing protein [Paraburkholderia fungorum]MDE1006127.1 heavy-metal-associated domain-containing protein [Paraburkholderia fungorum]PNE59562.1 copper chaperone [Paraburkholderia fungorum]PRZ52545.1 copper chaperone [Paraburkholderia fungorum]